jgi:hypothetical protein
MATPINIKDVYHLISKASGKYQYAKFITKHSKKERCMIYRVSGSSDASGDPLPIHRVVDDVSHSVLTVWDMNEDGYRRINLGDIVSLVVDKTEYEVTH